MLADLRENDTTETHMTTTFTTRTGLGAFRGWRRRRVATYDGELCTDRNGSELRVARMTGFAGMPAASSSFPWCDEATSDQFLFRLPGRANVMFGDHRLGREVCATPVQRPVSAAHRPDFVLRNGLAADRRDRVRSVSFLGLSSSTFFRTSLPEKAVGSEA